MSDLPTHGYAATREAAMAAFAKELAARTWVGRIVSPSGHSEAFTRLAYRP
jgi:hypothetical protein